jgi:FtsP/CotA-like multicopper oxidase with cupredoxin domain
LAVEAMDNGLPAPALAVGMPRVKSAGYGGARMGNRLSRKQSQTLFNTPNITTLKVLALSKWWSLASDTCLRRLARRTAVHGILLASCLLNAGAPAPAQTGGCPVRLAADGIIRNPAVLSSANAFLNVGFTLRSQKMHELALHECYVYQSASGLVEAPTLRLNPGDRVELDLTNRLTYIPPGPPNLVAGHSHDEEIAAAACSSGNISATSTNLHFHGLDIPPKCHQDDVLTTTIASMAAPFEYRFAIPLNAPPGLYWYHPHLHGFSTLQVNGGASGALIVSGMEKVKPEVAGLPERVLVIRQEFKDADSWLPGPNHLTVNFQPAIYPRRRSPIIQMKPGVKEFWRVANAASQAFLALELVYDGVPQNVTLIALDGIPVRRGVQLSKIELPPAGRAEFIVAGPAAGQAASFRQAGFDTGRIGPLNPSRELARIVVTPDAAVPPAAPPGTAPPYKRPPDGRVSARRSFYFAEAANGTNGPTRFFLAAEGTIPTVFNPSGPPTVTTKVGALEDWVIANHAGEVHAFHIHQIHFLFLELNGRKLPNPEWRDTVVLPAWDGAGPYPAVKLRLDFRDPSIVGIFPFHCHILDHEDAGMMATVQVNPK